MPSIPPPPISTADPAPETYLQIKGVAKRYGAQAPVLADINLTVARGEFVAIVGYSGSGKTTLINLIAGLATPDAGTITCAGRLVDGPDSNRGVVFQNYSLLPWLTVAQNVALAVEQCFPLWPAEERRAHVERHLEIVNLTRARDRLPRELSGGMRQRVALARGLAMNPRVLLLDEPLGALDALTRGTLQQELARIWESDRKTVVLITNDVDEALLLADRIIPLTAGPRATLAEAIPVPLARPRDRQALNHDLEFKSLRAAVTGRLLALGEGRRARAAGSERPPSMHPAAIPAGRPFFHWHARHAAEAAAASA